jgi:hypothetical protein
MKTQRWNESWVCDVNEQINGLVANYNLAPLPEWEWMWTLNVEKMESFSKIDLKDVSKWMSIIDACKLEAPIINKL